VAKTDPELSLESEQLEQYLETVTPEQPVVVIQYRNRGVSTWVFLTLIVVLPLAAIFLYHRFVVERYRVQDARSRRGRDAARRSASLSTIVPVPSASAATVPAAPVAAAAAASAALGQTTPAVSLPESAIDTATPRDSASKDPERNSPPVASMVQPPSQGRSAPIDADNKPASRLRTILPKPLPPDHTAGTPAGESTASGLADQSSKSSTAAGSAPGKPAAQSNEPHDRIAEDNTLLTHVADTRQRAAAKDAQRSLPAVQPLPSKEESLLQIAEEARRKQAELAARDENRELESRARRLEERMKFREELRAILRVHGNQAGPEIDKLAQRYGYDIDTDRYEQGIKIWRSARSPLSKVRLIRSLELPESVILNFLSDDLHMLVRSRSGPRNENEVRVRAAQKLLSYELPAAEQWLRGGAGAARPEIPAPPRPLSPPAEVAGSRPH
jgi:hypothetical protein